MDMTESTKTTATTLLNTAGKALESLTLEFFRPMLAASLPSAKRNVPTEDQVIRDLKSLDWERGFYASPKMDGIRAIKHPASGLVSRTLKPIPNKYIQQSLNLDLFDFLDGELILEHWDSGIEYNDNQSAIMTREGKPYFSYCVFDHIQFPQYTFRWRNDHARKIVEYIQGYEFPFKVHHLEQRHVKSVEELLEYEQTLVAKGFEGIIVRDPGNRYKNNRATWREQGMFKMKRFLDAEGVIVDFEELHINANDAAIDNLGYQKRSSHKDGKVPAGTLGKLVLEITSGEFAGEITRVGSGIEDSLRNHIWQNKSKYRNQIVKFKYQGVGSKNLPRTPIFLGFRSGQDL